MKQLTAKVLILLVLTGCAAATPARDANLVLQRLQSGLKDVETNDFAAARALMIKARDDYHNIIGESVLFDRLTALLVEFIDLEEQEARAIKNGADTAPYL